MDNIRRIAKRILAAADKPFAVAREMFIPGVLVNPRYQGLAGNIVIGGGRGDVLATSAYADNKDGVDGVTLVDVEFRTTLDSGDLDLLDEAMEVVLSSYASIQEDTFMPSRRHM